MNSIKKLLFTIGASAVLIAVISSSSLGSDYPKNENNTNQIKSVTESSKNPAYIIGIYKGYVAVYKYGSDEPFKITEVPVDSLTQGDEVLLTKGIEVADDKELQKRLEDYS